MSLKRAVVGHVSARGPSFEMKSPVITGRKWVWGGCMGLHGVGWLVYTTHPPPIPLTIDANNLQRDTFASFRLYDRRKGGWRWGWVGGREADMGVERGSTPIQISRRMRKTNRVVFLFADRNKTSPYLRCLFRGMDISR